MRIFRPGKKRLFEIPVTQFHFQDIFRLLMCKIFLIQQHGNDAFKAFSCTVRIAVRTQPGGSLGKPAEEDGLCQIQFGSVSAEIISCGGFDPVNISAVGQNIEIPFQDLIFGMSGFKISCLVHLCDFIAEGTAFYRAFLPHGNQLHGDGGCTGNDPAIGHKLFQCPHDSIKIHAGVFTEPPVLGSYGHIDQMLRKFLKGNGKTAA